MPVFRPFNYRWAMLAAGCAYLAGCATQLPMLDESKVDDQLNLISCSHAPDPGSCSSSFGNPRQDNAKARELRLLRAYMLLEAAARFGAARFSVYSDAPGDDAYQLMGNISSAVSALTEAESIRGAAGQEPFSSQTGYPVDRTVALFRVISVLDSASKPVFRGVTGMLILSSNVDRIRNAADIIKRVGQDTLFVNAYQDSAAKMVELQTTTPIPYEKARSILLARLNERCIDLARLAGQKEGHLCGPEVKAK